MFKVKVAVCVYSPSHGLHVLTAVQYLGRLSLLPPGTVKSILAFGLSNNYNGADDK